MMFIKLYMIWPSYCVSQTTVLLRMTEQTENNLHTHTHTLQWRFLCILHDRHSTPGLLFIKVLLNSRSKTIHRLKSESMIVFSSSMVDPQTAVAAAEVGKATANCHSHHWSQPLIVKIYSQLTPSYTQTIFIRFLILKFHLKGP